jgi:ABC-type glycerol-3-phosphate transport system substrate-binding protein
MRRRLFQLLAIVVALALTTSFGTTKEVELWFVPMSQEGPQKAPVLKWIKENLPKLLPQGVTVSDNYGPPIYQDAQQKFIVQGRRGKPDVIEGVLEGMIAYQRGGLLAPLDDYFGKWPDKSQFIQSTLKALTINGKLYGVPYNTNVRVLLHYPGDGGAARHFHLQQLRLRVLVDRRLAGERNRSPTYVHL